MKEHLPWVILLALLVWTVAPLVHDAFLNWRERRARKADHEPPAENIPADEPPAHAESQTSADIDAGLGAAAELAHDAEAQATAEEDARRKAAAEQEARRVEAERIEAERQQALVAEQARLAAQAAAAEQARLAEAAAAAAQEKARREESERQAARQAAEEVLSRPAPPAPSGQPRRPEETRVLVADDSKVVRVKTSRLLMKLGYLVTVAEDGTDAVRQIAANPPHILITDVEMPGMDGFELSAHVRGLPHLSRLPIIMVTAAEDKHAPQAAQVGVDLLLGKPYRDEDLTARVESLLALGVPAGEPALR